MRKMLGTLTVWLISAAALISCSMAGLAASPTPQSPPADIERLGSFRLPTDSEQADAISSIQAVDAARNDGWLFDGHEPTTFLLFHTGGSPGDPDASGQGLVWIVRWDDLNIVDDPPPVASGEEPPSRPPLDFTYVTIDGLTGDILSAVSME